MPRLCLSRKKNESFYIGSEIIVTVAEIRRDKVRLIVDAPREIPVDRQEVRQAKEQSRGGQS